MIEVDKDLIIVKNHWSDTAENSFKVMKMAMTIVNINNEKIFEVMADSIDQIFDGEDIYDDSTTSKKEKIEFVQNLTRQQFERIEEFFENIPKLTCNFSAVNPNTGVRSDYTVEGLSNFFG